LPPISHGKGMAIPLKLVTKLTNHTMITSPGESIKTIPNKQLFHSSAWIILGSFSSSLFRFIGNLILTRLLFPEAFGLMALMSAFMQGLEMFSDVGIGPSIIQNKRGDDDSFLRTAWTIQVLRGSILWIFSCLLAWPISIIYGQEMILQLLPIIGFNAVLNGFNSTALFTLNRHLQLKKIVIIELVSQLGGLLLAILWAWLQPTVWALVFSGLFSTFIKFALSFSLFPSIRHYFHWESKSASEIFHFGKWIFFSTIFTFIAGQGDRLILGKMISLTELGVYSIAAALASFLILIVQNLSGRIQFPLFSRLANESMQSLRQQLFKSRSWIIGIALFPLIIFVSLGDKIIALLYDQRYHEAAWIFQLLSFGSIGSLFEITLTPIFLAVGNSYRQMLLMLCKALLLIACLFIGGWIHGLYGAVAGIALSNFLFYGVVCYNVKYYDIHPLKLDLGFFSVAFALIIALWTLTHHFP